jgi:predicted glutamine amidotransferase
MCRFVAYQGHPVLLADLLYRPRHSLVAQSRQALHMSQPFNADGFGVGWYAPEAAPFPCVVKSAQPAWANRSVESLSLAVSSGLVFGHVRAASPGLAVQDSNCHPFQHGRFLFMHNGLVQGFRALKRRLQRGLADWAWASIEGTTDSEHAFALLLDTVGSPEAELKPRELRDALCGTLRRLAKLAREAKVGDEMACNFALTDGRATVVCRHARGLEPATLYYSAGRRYECADDDGEMLGSGSLEPGAVIVSSEPLTRRPEDWTPIPPNHTLTIGPALETTLERIAD